MASATQSLTLEQFVTWAERADQRLHHPDFAPVLKTCALILVSYTKQNFDGGHSPDGVPWAALLHPSARRGGPSARPLRDTGLLMASVTGTGAGNVTQITQTALVWGTNVSYAGFHQGGTRYMVARPFLGITEEAADDMASAFGEWVERQMG